jgi:hypothetical protein
MKKRQNTSYAVMAQRIEPQDSLDDFPTPPWATRALIEHVLGGKKRVKSQVCLEPACGSGHLAKVLAEYFGTVTAADIHPYGYGDKRCRLDHHQSPLSAGRRLHLARAQAGQERGSHAKRRPLLDLVESIPGQVASGPTAAAQHFTPIALDGPIHLEHNVHGLHRECGAL